MLFPALPLLFISTISALNNGLARTPQMGWNNWNSLGCQVSQSLLLETSNALIASGLRDVGYKYVILDDCWSDGRDEDGHLRVNQDKFPKGMKWLAGELHAKGLLYGMYSSAGVMTCARYEGSLDHEEEDAMSFASWNVDYLKHDNCFNNGRFGLPQISFDRFSRMSKALNATDRPMLYSLCNWGEDYVHTWGHTIANSWRMTGDIYDHFNRPDAFCPCQDPADPHCRNPGERCSVMNILNRVAPLVGIGYKGGWLDLDMLEVGHGGMTDDEYTAHFSMWAAMKSPLVIGADIRHLDAKALTILNNPAVIAVNQDPLGRSAVQVQRDLNVKKDRYGQGETQIWSGPLWPNDQVVIFLNAADEDLDMSATLADIFVYEGPEGSAPQARQTFDIYDLWAGRMDDSIAEQLLAGNGKHAKDWYNSTETSYQAGLQAGDRRLLGTKIGMVGGKTSDITVRVPRHRVKMYRLRGKEPTTRKYVIEKDEL
jgi:alpha-galactosidase